MAIIRDFDFNNPEHAEKLRKGHVFAMYREDGTYDMYDRGMTRDEYAEQQKARVREAYRLRGEEPPPEFL